MDSRRVSNIYVSLIVHASNGHIVLLVVIVPRIVPLKYVSTTLGAHKAVSRTLNIHQGRMLRHSGPVSSSKLVRPFSKR